MPQSTSDPNHDCKKMRFFSKHTLLDCFLSTKCSSSYLSLSRVSTFHRNFFHSLHWSMELQFDLQQSGFAVCERWFSRCRSVKKRSHCHVLNIFFVKRHFICPQHAQADKRMWGAKLFILESHLIALIFKHRFCKSYLEAVRILCLFNILSMHTFHNKLFSNASEISR